MPGALLIEIVKNDTVCRFNTKTQVLIKIMKGYKSILCRIQKS